jgi:hypothetical protein
VRLPRKPAVELELPRLVLIQQRLTGQIRAGETACLERIRASAPRADGGRRECRVRSKLSASGG